MVGRLAPKSACLIPARIGSTRFPRKPLASIAGRPMIEIVARNAARAFGGENTFVVTDSLEILEIAEAAGSRSILAATEFATGTDRIASVKSQLDRGYEWLFNVQGDEPALTSEAMKEFAQKTFCSEAPVTNAFLKSSDTARISSQNSIKMAITERRQLAYASRSVIPSLSSLHGSALALQVCIYGFRPEALWDFGKFSRNPEGLEANENVEILRFLDMGLAVEMVETTSNSHPVDVPEDIPIVERIIKGGS